MKPDPTTADPLRTYIDVPITLADGSADTVRMRELPVKLFEQAGEVMMNELQFVELVAAKPRGWAETLTPESLTQVAEAAEEVNGNFFAYSARRLKKLERLAPGAVARMFAPARG